MTLGGSPPNRLSVIWVVPQVFSQQTFWFIRSVFCSRCHLNLTFPRYLGLLFYTSNHLQSFHNNSCIVYKHWITTSEAKSNQSLGEENLAKLAKSCSTWLLFLWQLIICHDSWVQSKDAFNGLLSRDGGLLFSLPFYSGIYRTEFPYFGNYLYREPAGFAELSAQSRGVCSVREPLACGTRHCNGKDQRAISRDECASGRWHQETAPTPFFCWYIRWPCIKLAQIALASRLAIR